MYCIETVTALPLFYTFTIFCNRSESASVCCLSAGLETTNASDACIQYDRTGMGHTGAGGRSTFALEHCKNHSKLGDGPRARLRTRVLPNDNAYVLYVKHHYARVRFKVPPRSLGYDVSSMIAGPCSTCWISWQLFRQLVQSLANWRRPPPASLAFDEFFTYVISTSVGGFTYQAVAPPPIGQPTRTLEMRGRCCL